MRDEKKRKEHSRILSNVWADEESVFNSEEFRRNLRESQRRHYENATEAQQQARVEALRQSWVDADERRDKAREAAKDPKNIEKRARGTRKFYADAERSAHCRTAISQKSSELMNDPKHKERCTRKLIEAAQRTGGTSSHEREIMTILEPLGFVHHHRLGSSYVDFFHAQKNLVIEYFGDWWHCHPRFDKRINENYDGIHPNIGMAPSELRMRDEKRLNNIRMLCDDVVVIWQSDVYVHGRLDATKLIRIVSQFLDEKNDK